MSLTLFNQFPGDLAAEKHTLASDTLKLGIVNNTTVPDAALTTPVWGSFSANEVVSTGGYTSGGITLTHTWTLESGIWVLRLASLELAQNTLGFTNGYWGIVFNESAPSDEALGFIDLSGADETLGAIRIRWNDASVGSLGIAATLRTT